MKYYVTIGARTMEVELGPEGVRVDGRAVEADLQRMPDSRVHSLLLDGRSHRILARRNGGGTWDLHLRGRRVRAEVLDERTRAIRALTASRAGATGPRPITAPMPGLVVRVEVEEGDEVRSGQGLVIVEAMKMENELRAEGPGRVATVHARPGQPVEKDQVLIEFEAPEDV